MIPDTTANKGERMSILCAILQYDPGAAESNSTITDPKLTVFPVTFQVPSTNEYMTCSTSKINVQSVRWPHQRFTAPERPRLPLLNLLKGSANAMDALDTPIDAAVWVMPLCGGAAPPAICAVSNAARGSDFTRASCYPYCLAVRQRGSFNSMMTLYNQLDWINRVHIFNRDCALHRFNNPNISNPTIQTSTNIIQTGKDILTTAASKAIADALNYGGLTTEINGDSVSPTILAPNQVSTIIPSDLMGSTLLSPDETPDSVYCVQSNLATSTIPKQFFQDLGDYGETAFRSMLASGQPFIFAGDTVLVSDCESLFINYTAYTCTVYVYRIYGSDGGQMTLVSLPALALLLSNLDPLGIGLLINDLLDRSIHGSILFLLLNALIHGDTNGILLVHMHRECMI